MRALRAALLALTVSVPAMAQPASEPKSTEASTVQVFNEQNEPLGEASELVVGEAGNVRGLIVRVSDASAAAREVVVPLDRVKDASTQKIVVAATKDELKAMPKLQEMIPDTLPDQL
jgi:hypothetical protein